MGDADATPGLWCPCEGIRPHSRPRTAFPLRRPRLRCGVPHLTAAGVKLRTLILLFLLVFGLTPLILAVLINLPLVLDRTALFYQKAYLQNLRADFRDLDQHLASRNEMIRLLTKLPEPGLILGEEGDAIRPIWRAPATRAGSTRFLVTSATSSRSCSWGQRAMSASGSPAIRRPGAGPPAHARRRRRAPSSWRRA